MFKSLLAASALVALASLVGCAEPQLVEAQGESSSHQEVAPSAADDAAANRILDRIEAKTNNCEPLVGDELKTLRTFQGKIDWTFEAYVSFTCTVEEGEIVVGSATMETRAGWSSKDGNFSEQAFEGSASVEIPLKAIDLNAAITHSVTVRQSGLTVSHDESTEVSVGVSRDLGIVKGSADISFDGSAVTVSGGAEAPLPIKTTDCVGDESVGFTLSLSAEHVDTASPAVAQRAWDIEVRSVKNNDELLILGGPGVVNDPKRLAAAQKQCCIDFETCN